MFGRLLYSKIKDNSKEYKIYQRNRADGRRSLSVRKKTFAKTADCLSVSRNWVLQTWHVIVCKWGTPSYHGSRSALYWLTKSGRPINEREFPSSLPTNAEANFSQSRCLDDEISNRTDYEIDMKQTIKLTSFFTINQS